MSNYQRYRFIIQTDFGDTRGQVLAYVCCEQCREAVRYKLDNDQEIIGTFEPVNRIPSQCFICRWREGM